jgi:hypothetical protein
VGVELKKREGKNQRKHDAVNAKWDKRVGPNIREQELDAEYRDNER